uniref:Uncharacterized protein n=1 Tax=Seriola dumerili TaxID=41447 RepID=A0A3B4UPA7_SERDU
MKVALISCKCVYEFTGFDYRLQPCLCVCVFVRSCLNRCQYRAISTASQLQSFLTENIQPIKTISQHYGFQSDARCLYFNPPTHLLLLSLCLGPV